MKAGKKKRFLNRSPNMALEKRDSGGSGSTTPSSDIVLTVTGTIRFLFQCIYLQRVSINYQTLDQQSSIAALSLRGVEVSRAPSCSNASGKLVRRNSSNGLIRSLVASSAPASSSSHSRTTRSSTLTKHEETLCTFLAASANSPWLTDVKLICDDGSLLASRFVLASASPKFLRQVRISDIVKNTTLLDVAWPLRPFNTQLSFSVFAGAKGRCRHSAAGEHRSRARGHDEGVVDGAGAAVQRLHLPRRQQKEQQQQHQ